MASARSRRRLLCIGAVPPALLFLLACGGAERDPAARLAIDFPEHADAVLQGRGQGFAAAGKSFVPRSTLPGWQARLTVELPERGAGAIVFSTPAGLTVRVVELRASGAGRIEGEGVVAYASEASTSFWTTTETGGEEWIQLEASAVHRGAPVASFRVDGASVIRTTEGIELRRQGIDDRILVTAPAAFARGGRAVRAWLEARGDTIDLYVDASNEPILVDPFWTTPVMMPTVRYDHAAALLDSGKVLACGGTTGLGGGVLATSAIYTPSSDSWVAGAAMITGRRYLTATTLGDGTVLAAAGADANTKPVNVSETFDPVGGSWGGKPNLATARFLHTANLLADGRVLVAGGYGLGGSGSTVSIASAEIYDPNMAGGAWGPTDPMFVARARHTAIELQDHTILVAGGDENGVDTTDSEIYDPATGHWTTTTGPLNTSRQDHAATLLGNGQVLVDGGLTGGVATASAELYDPVSGLWTTTLPMGTARANHTSSILTDGRVLVAGGTDGTQSLNTAEYFDPNVPGWAPAPPMTTPRDEYTATVLKGGDVLVAGGDGAMEVDLSERFSLAGTQGSPCTQNSDCSSGFCADGVCCDKACGGGVCQACSVAKGATTDGTCTNLSVACDDGDVCTTNDTCSNGKCVGTPKTCTPIDDCHAPGVCDAASGMCSVVPKADGASCDDGNPCSIGTCHTGVCVGVNELDGTVCDGGACVAGRCLLDPTTNSGSGGATTTTTTTSATSTAATSGGGGSGGVGGTSNGSLEGGGCAVDPTESRSGVWLFAGLVAWLAKRRRASAVRR